METRRVYRAPQDLVAIMDVGLRFCDYCWIMLYRVVKYSSSFCYVKL